MIRKPTSKRTRPEPKAVLRLPDLDQAKSAVLNSLTSADAQRGYRHAIDEFVDWYCSVPVRNWATSQGELMENDSSSRDQKPDIGAGKSPAL